MTTSKLINYTTREFVSENELELYASKQDDIFTPEVIQEFKKAGMLRRVLTRIWNKEGVFRLGNMWEYKDEKAFIECQKLFREAEMKFDQKAQISVKNFSNRGIILYDVIL